MAKKEIEDRFKQEVENLWGKFKRSEITSAEYYKSVVKASEQLQFDLWELRAAGRITYDEYYDTVERLVNTIPEQEF